MIREPIVYKDDDKVLVERFDAQPQSQKLPAYWVSTEVDSIKSRIKTFYIVAQNTKCCYCNRHLGSQNHRVWDVEHIASRAKHARFMFTPKNLAAACPDCNIAKSDQEIMVNPNKVSYPDKSEDFRIIHPHFDVFEDHIEIFTMIMAPRTEKGKKTIYVCDLLRFSTKYIDWPNSAADKSFEAEIDEVFSGESPASVNALQAIIAKLPTR